MEAGKYRRHWLYLSSTSKKNPAASLADTFYLFQPVTESPKPNHNDIARKAACAVLAHSGSCDEHAYVVAMLLQLLLPANTKINICTLFSNRSEIPHTFVVLGDAIPEHEVNKIHSRNDELLVVDAWPIVGGVVKLNDFFMRTNDSGNRSRLRIVDALIADGKDRLLGRVYKQMERLNQLATANYKIINEVAGYTHHELAEQVDFEKLITPMQPSLLKYYERSFCNAWLPGAARSQGNNDKYPE